MVVPPGSATGGLESLPARPPTPPRETQQQQHRAQNHSRPLHPLLNLQTPPGHSPVSPSDSSLPTSQRLRKRVGFTGHADYQEPPVYSDKKNVEVVKQPTPISLPSSATSTRPLKSILKPSPARNPLDPGAGDTSDGARANLATMLESTIKQLAGADRDCKVDAYMMLVRALKVSNNLPDRIALQDKMSLFAQFIQRDITTKSSGGGIDSSLTNHALTLLVTFQHFPAIASTLTNDFGVFIIDHCIRSFEDASVPKDVVRHLMQVVASQEFSPKVMTADRVGRLVSALHNIENHLKGKSIIMSRIIIYRKLVKQSRQHMLMHSDWLLDLFTDMLSTLKEIRSSAIALGFDTCLTLGKEKQLSKRVLEILQVSVDDTKYIEYYIERLKAMAKDKADSAVVPQIWSVVVLLLRYPVDRWEYFVPWLDIIQKCFNSSDWQTKHEANLAWNRLVYTLHQNETSFFKTLGTMCQPFVSQLRRKVTGAKQGDLRQTVLGSICNLYYYAFKPNTNPTHLDTLWKTCIVPIVNQLGAIENELKGPEKYISGTTTDNVTHAATLLTGIFDSSTARLWKEDRVFDKALVTPAELPALDPKWIRRNAAKVFLVVSPILEVSFLNLSDPNSNASKLWRTIVNAVVAASSKEVKVSTDTAVFIGSALSFLLRIWSSGLDDADIAQSRRFLNAVQQYITAMLSCLGLLPFTEKQLSMSKQNMFVPAATPSHRDVKGHASTKSPLCHLFWILSTPPPNIPDDEHMHTMVVSVLSPFFATRPVFARRDLAHELMHSLPQESSSVSATWQFIAGILETALINSKDSHSSISSSGEPAIGHQYRGIVKHLERGLVATPNLQRTYWQSLLAAVTDCAVEETGFAGCAVAVIEPLAKAAVDLISHSTESLSDHIHNVGCELISRSTQPHDRQALETARRRLWGTLAAGTRSASLDPFDNLYRLINSLLMCSYNKVDTAGFEEPAVRMLSEITAFLARSNTQLALGSLLAIQSGISRWLRDADSRYDSKQSSPVYNAVQALWDRVCCVFGGSEGLRQTGLSSVELLLCAAFGSKHANLVKSTAALWNQAFEHEEAVDYPEKLKDVLLAVHTYADIVLPGLRIPNHPDSMESFVIPESQHSGIEMDTTTDAIAPLPQQSSDGMPQSGKALSPRTSSPVGSVKLSFPAARSAAITPRRTLRKRERKRVSNARLRHDDSQIHFAAIDSSSPSGDVEPQHLTERQIEIRERQRDASVLFPELRSSAGQNADSLELEPQLPQQIVDHAAREHAATPERNQAFEDFVSSTPTPRRGQAALIIEDHYGLDEVPSSPPEPRRNLLPEMRTRSRSSSSIMDDFQFSSSPVPGSPTLEQMNSAKGKITVQDDPAFATDQFSTRNDVPLPASGLATVQDGQSSARVMSRPSTPPNRRRTRSRKDSPKSDNENEEFVDALTSPQHKSPRIIQKNEAHLAMSSETNSTNGGLVSRSFDLSEGEERSMARLIVELDSRKCDPVPRPDSLSPVQAAKRTTGPVMECITVKGESDAEMSTPRRSPRHAQITAPVIPSTPMEIESPQSSLRRSRRKRKRTTEVADSTQKKRKHKLAGQDAEVDAGLGSQACSDESSLAALDTSFSSAAEDGSMEREPSQELGAPATSSPLAVQQDNADIEAEYSDANSSDISESEAVNSQLLAEASQDSYGSHSQQRHGADSVVLVKHEPGAVGNLGEIVDEHPVNVVREDTTETPWVAGISAEANPAASIIASLRAGLSALQTAQLSRKEVYEIEDMFMDIKKALYAADERSRSSR
ncbi:Rap1-interacting factor 1 N terminal-domain-containing protein [Microdochium trichocladiopsis]|uniref:Rap1-interacting factor 1 N terminal-domain-containing protein n=1 Tax=Microdochium trichocladiopsis TaxID=1682393 RepID=A0A9P8Y0X0_9PEZI|nr:Rap1-interacting factor 1 N terminal-domain-containing protein [Microdochium trichocladiopsis]KAH7027823.1 Rap1-interacting factor 1 N terminal-domain-containing protein [Microdochium trichocladiopsis]